MADASKLVMVVDDAALVRRYYREALEAAGFEVGESLNGLEALEKLLQGPVDLLIVDLNMPQMDGITFIETLRRQQDASLAATPTLVTSTESAQKDIAAARRAGANFYLVKPITREALVEFAAMLCGIPR